MSDVTTVYVNDDAPPQSMLMMMRHHKPPHATTKIRPERYLYYYFSCILRTHFTKNLSFATQCFNGEICNKLHSKHENTTDKFKYAR